jgi:hypothetical protein
MTKQQADRGRTLERESQEAQARQYQIDESMCGPEFIGGQRGLVRLVEILKRRGYDVVAVVDATNGANNGGLTEAERVPETAFLDAMDEAQDQIFTEDLADDPESGYYD